MRSGLLTFFGLLNGKIYSLDSRRCMSKTALLYKILNDFSAPNLKELLIKRSSFQTDYDLRNSHTDLALPKPRLVLHFGIAFRAKLRKRNQFTLLKIL
jgi:hypothetical protein